MNEGDNFGTANGGNGQPNDNSFDSGQPASAIMSDSGSGAKQGNIPVISTSGATNTSKFFGGRSHRGSRAKTGNQQNDFLAAQKIASDPNTPQFFSEAVVANSFTPSSAPRSSKRPLIIGAIALVVVGIIITSIVFLLQNQGAGEQTVADKTVDELVEKWYGSRAMDAEYACISLYNGKISAFDGEISADYVKKIKDSLNEIDVFYDDLGRVDTSKLDKGIPERIEKTREIIKERKGTYDKIADTFETLYLAAYKGDDDSANKMSSHPVASNFIKNMRAYNKVNNQYDNNQCYDDDTSATCQSLIKQRSDIRDKLNEDTGLLSKSLREANEYRELKDDGGIESSFWELMRSIKGVQ